MPPFIDAICRPCQAVQSTKLMHSCAKMAGKQLNLSEAEAAAERAKLRQALKQDFQKKLTHPFRHGHGEGGFIFDPAVQRFMSMRASQLDFFKVTPKTTRYGLLLSVIPFFGLGYTLKYLKDKKENLYRTGQVAYKDRPYKFL